MHARAFTIQTAIKRLSRPEEFIRKLQIQVLYYKRVVEQLRTPSVPEFFHKAIVKKLMEDFKAIPLREVKDDYAYGDNQEYLLRFAARDQQPEKMTKDIYAAALSQLATRLHLWAKKETEAAPDTSRQLEETLTMAQQVQWAARQAGIKLQPPIVYDKSEQQVQVTFAKGKEWIWKLVVQYDRGSDTYKTYMVKAYIGWGDYDGPEIFKTPTVSGVFTEDLPGIFRNFKATYQRRQDYSAVPY